MTKAIDDIHFTGTEAECEAEKSRLESVGQEAKEFYCDRQKFVEGGRCDKQCDFCQRFMTPKPEAKPTYTREEFLKVATAAMNAEISMESDIQIHDCEVYLGIEKGSYKWKEHYPIFVAKRSCEYADSLLSEVQKRF